MTNDKAYEILSNGLVNAPSEHEWCEAFNMAMDLLKEPNQPNQRKAGWVEHNTGCNIYYYCSLCGLGTYNKVANSHVLKFTRFCPNCGAEMVGIEIDGTIYKIEVDRNDEE